MKKDNITQNNDFLGKESLGKLMFKLTLPAVTAQVINMFYFIVDRIYIGHIPNIGALALTGVGITTPLILAISAFAALVFMGGAPRASIKMGEGDYKTAEKIMGNSYVLLIIISLILTTFTLIFGKNMLYIFGASENTIEYAFSYMQIYALGTIFVQLTLGMNAFITAQGFAKTGMYTILIGAVLNIILDPLFIYAFELGVRGAAIATVISQACAATWVITFLKSKRSILHLKKENYKLEKNIILSILALGSAPFIMQLTESILYVSFNSSLLKYGGDIAVGAMTILSSLMQFTMLPLMGFTQGAQPIISYNFGAKNADRVKGAFKLLLKISVIYSTILWTLIMLFPHVFVGMFTNDTALREFSVWAIHIYMAVSILLGIQVACQQTFIAIGNAKTSLFLALLRKVILLIPLIYILPIFFENKVMAVYLAEPVSDTVAVIVTVSLFTIQFRKALKELRESENLPEKFEKKYQQQES
ncbi:MATE family efflux transporter [Petrotoga sp. 9PWA.NaAc.5.4]|uniref:MATE family efflux transporter n=1 Tax=Petrotoga sp. 9PWA.NaAc.5.4 TaxID=1434328 RepID=UPI000CBE096B|nr:MATE family efflux transporter [Petrotoga sp. 9PWA.NaAc.5.4]PNR93648.1 multidrug transporter MatE [Petrotoga sp. 9PWA.NaAc.5.4]